jgi:hypothetical protein
MLKISPSWTNEFSIPAECAVVNSVEFFSGNGWNLAAYVVSWLLKECRDSFFTLPLLNIPTNTNHGGINRGNVGVDDLGHRKTSHIASIATRTARVSIWQSAISDFHNKSPCLSACSYVLISHPLSAVTTCLHWSTLFNSMCAYLNFFSNSSLLEKSQKISFFFLVEPFPNKQRDLCF